MGTLRDFGLIQDAPDSILGQKAYRYGEYPNSREALNAAKQFYDEHKPMMPVIEKRGEVYVMLLKLDDAYALGLVTDEKVRITCQKTA